MADDKKKDGGEPAVEFKWDPLVPAHDKTFSTTVRIEISGWWPEVRPRQVALSRYEEGQEPSAGNAVRIQKGHGTFPLVGLKPGHHYLVVVYIEDRLPVQKMITVPELPKPKRPEEDALELEQIELKRAQVSSERRKLEVQEKKPTEDEKKTDELKAKIERVKAEQELKETERKLAQELKRARHSEPLTPTNSAISPKPEPTPISSFKRGQEAAQRLFGEKVTIN